MCGSLALVPLVHPRLMIISRRDDDDTAAAAVAAMIRTLSCRRDLCDLFESAFRIEYVFPPFAMIRLEIFYGCDVIDAIGLLKCVGSVASGVFESSFIRMKSSVWMEYS